MFCPNCKSEYRFGFTKCSDCGADLVDYLPDSKTASTPQSSTTTDLLWSGDSKNAADMIGDFLKESKIEFEDDDLEFGMIHLSLPPVYKIWINPNDHAAAQECVNDALKYIEEQDRAEAAREEAESESVGDAPSDDALEFDLNAFNPDEATDQVWSGADSDMKDMFVASLREIGIGSVAEEANGEFTVRVEPGAASRAREIIREIVEQTPPA